MQSDKLREMLQRAFCNAVTGCGEIGGNDGVVHRKRSAKWVECLTSEFEQVYPDGDYHVFARHKPKWGNQSELLFDIHVCTISSAMSMKNKKLVAFTSKSIWAVESEFRNLTREWASDFQKLVASSADYKLFIGSLYEPVENQLKFFSDIAQHCTGEVFVALLPHPREWSPEMDSQVKLYRFVGLPSGWDVV